MAIKAVKYDLGRQDQWTDTADVDSTNTVTKTKSQYIQTYLVEDDGSGGICPPIWTALGASDPNTGLTVPNIGDTASINGNSSFIVTRVMPKRSTNSPLVFEVQIEYSATNADQPSGKDKWAVDLKFSGKQSQQQAYQDSNNLDIVNSAGQAYDPSVTETIYDEVLSLSYSTTTPPDLDGMRGKVNSSAISFSISGISRMFSDNYN